MTLINKDNISTFISYYNEFHDSYITNINYDITKSQITIFIDDCYVDKPILKENIKYETKKIKIKMVFNGVEQYSNKEIFSWDYINGAYIKYIKIKNKDYICFATDKNDPLVYIVCDSIEYEELK